jgi:hypothetical protein
MTGNLVIKVYDDSSPALTAGSAASGGLAQPLSCWRQQDEMRNEPPLSVIPACFTFASGTAAGR